MTEVPFSRLFSMPAFEGLRVYRAYQEEHPQLTRDEVIARIRRVEANFRSYDLAAAEVLNSLVPTASAKDGVTFYRECISAILLTTLPEWAKLIPRGRGRFARRLDDEDLRDIGSLFRQARLLDNPPTEADVRWWDDIQAHVRGRKSADAMERARRAEQLTLSHEAEILRAAGIEQLPVWAAIEDNTLGYDVLSFRQGQFGLLNRLIEVKSTISSPLRFYLTANEWRQALKYGDAYVFHVWNLAPQKPVLYELAVAQVAPHVPRNLERGIWETALIPVAI